MRKRHILKYIQYKLTAKHKKGFSIHSPFAFKYITEIIENKTSRKEYQIVKNFRKILLKSKQEISINDLGAISHISRSTKRKIKSIAKFSSVNKKFGELLFRLAYYSQPKTIIELGTSLGISTSYLALSNNKTDVISIEGCPETAKIAKDSFEKLKLNNIKIYNGNFDIVLPDILKDISNPILVFFDGNHTKEATLNYFDQCLKVADTNSIFIFDDIYWSNGMEKAWLLIKQHPSVKVTFDLFRMGIVFFKKGLQKQDYVVRF